MIPWESRDPKMKVPTQFGFNPDSAVARRVLAMEAWYDYLINEWIPGQPDYKELMAYFIGPAKYDPLLFVVGIKKVTSCSETSEPPHPLPSPQP
jgi:hypothetical protein